jgi:catechol 2,3-dioxygenase-like lactoylglutathione lyase family enzyme
MAPLDRVPGRPLLLIFICSVMAIIIFALLASSATPTEDKKPMKFTHACLITQKMAPMRDFYREVLQAEPKVYQHDYLEFPLEGATLSLYQQESLDRTVPGAMQAGRNQSVMLEFQVADVDQEHARLKKAQVPIDWVMPPTTFPWGNRSIYFRDPEGNMVNLYSTVKSP